VRRRLPKTARPQPTINDASGWVGLRRIDKNSQRRNGGEQGDVQNMTLTAMRSRRDLAKALEAPSQGWARRALNAILW